VQETRSIAPHRIRIVDRARGGGGFIVFSSEEDPSGQITDFWLVDRAPGAKLVARSF